MTEKQVVEKVYDYFKRYEGDGNFTIWRSPAYKTMRWDIFGIFDLVVAFKNKSPFFIQCTTAPNLSARRKKIMKFFEDSKMFIPDCYVFAWNVNTEHFVIERVQQKVVPPTPENEIGGK